MINRDTVTSNLIQVVKDLVGSELSTLTNSSGTTPAVIRARQRGHKPDLPYMTVDTANFILPSGWLLASYFDDSNVMTYEVLYEMFVDFKCYGQDSKQILQSFHSYLSIPAITEKIRTEVLGASVQSQGAVVDTPDLLSTEYEEGATLTVSFYIIDTIQDPTGTAIERILDANGTGTLVTGVNGDLSVDFDTSTI